MTKLWILMAICIPIAYIIDNRDYYSLREEKPRQERLLTIILILVLGFFCGLRVWGNDTVTYLQMFEREPKLGEIFSSGITFEFSEGIGFHYVTSLLKTIGFSSQDFLMFFAFLTVIPYVIFVHKYSENMVFGVFLMLTTGFYTFSMAAIKQSVAIGFCLIAVIYAIEKKWILYAIWMFIACMFHPYAIIYLVVPLLMFKPWTKKTAFFVAIMVCAGIFMGPLIQTVLDVTSLMGADYSEDAFSGAGVNIFRVIVSFVPMIFATVYGKDLFKESTRADNLIFNLAMMNALIMFVGLFGTANYFARLANYFLPAQVIVVPWILKRLKKKDRKWLTIACVVGYTGYFIYEHAIIRPFDTGYSQISLFEYLKQLVLGEN